MNSGNRRKIAGVKGRSGGRNAKTRKQHRLEGTERKHRHVGTRNPEPPEGAPAKPATLTGEAAAEWDRMIERLTASKSLSLVDDGVLYDYVQLHALAERLQAELDALPSVFYTKPSQVLLIDGNSQEFDEPKVHPGVGQLRQARVAMKAFHVEFGLTPASRGRVKLLETPDEADPFSEFDGKLKAVK